MGDGSLKNSPGESFDSGQEKHDHLGGFITINCPDQAAASNYFLLCRVLLSRSPSGWKAQENKCLYKCHSWELGSNQALRLSPPAIIQNRCRTNLTF